MAKATLNHVQCCRVKDLTHRKRNDHHQEKTYGILCAADNDTMRHHTPPSSHSGFDGPDHFWLERNKAGAIAAWAVGIILFLAAVSLLA